MGSLPQAQTVIKAAALAAEKGQQAAQSPYGNPKICCFQMPLHYPRYTKADYQEMPEWKLNCLLTEYGLPSSGDLDCKRKFAMGAFLWPAQR